MVKTSGQNSSPSFFDKIGPMLLLGTIVMAFMVGVLWQKVSGLEKGTGSPLVNGGGSGTAPTSVPSPLSNLPALAKKAGVSESAFKSCYDSKKYAEKVENDYQSGIAAGVTGTPGSFVRNNKGETWFIPGAFPIAEVKAVMDIALGKEATLPAQVTKLDAKTASTLASVSDSDHVAGNSGAGVNLIVYSDIQCPFCQRFHPTVKQIVNDYKDQVSVVFRHFPLDQLHPLARPAAEASECVNELGGSDAFWKFLDAGFGVN